MRTRVHRGFQMLVLLLATMIALTGLQLFGGLPDAGAEAAMACQGLRCTTKSDCGSYCFCNNPDGGQGKGTCFWDTPPPHDELPILE